MIFDSLKKMFKPIYLLVLPILLFLTIFIVYNRPSAIYAQENTGEINIAALLEEPPSPPQPSVDQGERIMRALALAYPDRISNLQFRRQNENDPGDWAFQIDGRWLYYAEGRILPEDRRHRVSEYRAMGFNSNYRMELPSWESGEEQRAARTRNYEESLTRVAQPRPPVTEPRPPSPTRANYIFEAIWRGSSRAESWNQQVNISFLGFQFPVHSGLAYIMGRIEEIIIAESRTNQTVRQWINSLGSIAAWNWRNVASSGNRSFHSYGIAVDILPRNQGGLAIYWMWSAQHDPLWWNIPYSRRWHPPDPVINAFESHGFIWGGRWGNFDTMHFEYRPEAFVLSNIPLAFSRSDIPVN